MGSGRSCGPSCIKLGLPLTAFEGANLRKSVAGPLRVFRFSVGTILSYPQNAPKPNTRPTPTPNPQNLKQTQQPKTPIPQTQNPTRLEEQTRHVRPPSLRSPPRRRFGRQAPLKRFGFSIDGLGFPHMLQVVKAVRGCGWASFFGYYYYYYYY